MSLYAGSMSLCLAAGEGAPVKFNFNSLPIAEKLGEAAHKVLPYRTEDHVVVVVVDPIMCGQKPINPSYKFVKDRIVLHYDLTTAPVGSQLPNCSVHATFDLDPVPHGDFSVEFSGGNEKPHVAQMARCPNTSPKFDIWDCLVPVK